jgi:hypothetical protein
MSATNYFGENGYFAQACEKAWSRNVQIAIIAHAKTLGRSEIAYLLGYCFGEILREKSVPITEESLAKIAAGKITLGDPAVFVAVFVAAFHEANPAAGVGGAERSPKA